MFKNIEKFGNDLIGIVNLIISKPNCSCLTFDCNKLGYCPYESGVIYEEIKAKIIFSSSHAIFCKLKDKRKIWIPHSQIANLERIEKFSKSEDYQILKVSKWFYNLYNLGWN